MDGQQGTLLAPIISPAEAAPSHDCSARGWENRRSVMTITHFKRIVVAASTLTLSVAMVAPAPPATAKPGEPEPNRPELGQPDEEPPRYVEGEVLVGFKKDASDKDKSELHQRRGASVKKKLETIDVELVSVARGKEKEQAEEYRKEPKVAFVEVNGRYYAQAWPEDPELSKQWGYSNSRDADIDAIEAWAGGMPAPGPAIAILDTGVHAGHPDLEGKVARSQDFTGSGTGDVYGHGTHVAGTAAASTNNGKGGAGTCPECVLWNYKVLDNSGSGDWFAIASGITAAANDGAKVINMSFGAYYASQTVGEAVTYAWGKGVVLAAAAGNDGKNWGFYPGAFPDVIAVAASTNRDARASFSNWGGNWVDVAAPGEGILSTVIGGGYESWNGTSMASPHVAGIAGLVWSRGGCGTNDCVRKRIESQADPMGRTGSSSRDITAHGRVNACRGVKDAKSC
jgi:thermitase